MMPDLVLDRDGKVAKIRITRPPHNFFDTDLLRGIADALEESDSDAGIVVSLLSSEGRSFCAGADFARNAASREDARKLYDQAMRIFDRRKPLIAAVGGPAVGGGLGLAVAADFRIASPAARFHCNFAAIGLHPGFALTATLPALLGQQKARDVMLSARRIGGEEAVAIGLADRLGGDESLDADALEFAHSIAKHAPLALRSIRDALPRVTGGDARAALARELEVQGEIFKSADFKEGVEATAERRAPNFVGR